MKYIQKLITQCALALLLVTPVLAVAPAYAADPTDSASQSVCAAINCSDTTSSPTVSSVLRLVLNVLSFIIGFVAIIFIILNGLRFITANGEAGKIATARTAILYALIGLAIAALAQVMVHFVIGQVDKTTTAPTAQQCKSKSPPASCKKN